MGKIINKGWGHEDILIHTEHYCAKLLVFDREGAKSSLHFHKLKDETFLIQKGSFKLITVNTSNAAEEDHVLAVGDTYRLRPFALHQLIALEDDSVVLEVSTYDDPADSHRVRAGDVI